MKKTAICLLIVIFTFGTSFSQILPVHAAENDFTFTIGPNGATVTDYKGTDLNVVIPDEYEGTSVTEIGRAAFDTYNTGKPRITSVVIPDTVKVIQTYGFRYTSLTSIELPDGLLTIGSSAFENNPLTTVVFPDSVTMIGNYSFYMNNLTSIKLSENLKTINGGAFDTNHITKLVIPASVTNVASSSFYNNSLTSITVLGDATTFGSGVFASNPSNLKIFGIENSPVAAYASSNGHTFVDGTALFQALSSAKSLLKSKLVGTGVGQVSANAYNDLLAAYDAAMLFIDGIGNATIASDLASAATPLISSIEAFNAQIVQAGNPAALGAAIAAAQQALMDHPQGTNVGQTSAGARTALQSATDAAQQILDNAGNYTQDQLDTVVIKLNAAVQVFNAAVIQAGIPTGLDSAITAAQQALTDHPQGTDVGQTSAGARTALQSATDAAQQILDNAGNYTQDQLDTAVNELNAAVQVFNAAVIQAGIPTGLDSAITAAQQALTDHPQGTDVGQTSAGTRTALETALDAAQQILDNAGDYTQGQLDTAVNELNTAVQVFNAAVIQAGVPTALGAAITVAQQALADHPEGTDVGQTSAGTRTALETVLDAAQQILLNAGNYTQTQLDTVVNELDTAVQVFNTAVIKAGIPTALDSAITAAQQALADHPEGTDVGQTSAGERAALETALDVAQQIFVNAGNYTQDQLDIAVNELDTAVQVFNAAVIQAGIPTALDSAIKAAQQALADHPEGTDVGQTSAGTRTALETALDVAQQILDNGGNYTQDQLNTVVNELDSAVQVFNAAVIQAGIPTALDSAIKAAQQALADHPEGTDVGQTSGGDRATLQTAIDAAQAIADDAENQSQTRLDEATVSLNDAMAVFEAAWVGVVLTAPVNDLYGTRDTLRFTVFYGYEVTVIGTPVVPIRVGDNSVTQTVYASYMGARGEAVTKLTFEFEVPGGLADVDGIEVAAALELPNGASIVRTSSGHSATLTYAAPDVSGIRIASIPPEVALTVVPNGLERKTISVMASVYGVAAGNAMTQLRWLPGSLSEVDFVGGTKGNDILAVPQFTITTNGDYTVYALDKAGNEAVKTITVTGILTPSSSDNGNRPVPSSGNDDRSGTSGTTVKLAPNGGITIVIDPSDIKQVKRSDGTMIEKIILPERTRKQVLELLKDTMKPFVSITIGNREQVVQAQLQADWIADMVKANPNTIIEVRLNDSSYQLRLSAINLIRLAERLDAEISNLTVNIIQELAGEQIREEINRIGVSKGFSVFADVIDYKVMVEANGQMLEVHDYGGSYTIRTIKLDRENTNHNLVAVQYIPENGTVVFVPAKMETGPDGTNEAILNVPHNSLYTVVNVQARTFADLSGHWAKVDIEHLASKLLVNGVAADRFDAEGTVTRAEFSALLVRALGLSVKGSEGSDRFTDVPASAWYASAVNSAVASGMVSGIGSGRFAPNDPITREQMAVLMAGALTFTSHGNGSDGQEGGHLETFTDRDSISSWAQVPVVRVWEDGIMKGMEDGRFAPTENVTRAQAAVILKRFLQNVHFID
ncbi:leucine-rich repeat protein [Paenibacillus taichungensis]|uniref:leucine-rich repeat protein n=1 Tax=Paenibacillus taichungensis TaxID=484184 RepID=UPI003828CB06